jgi:hypothetical protein
MAHGRRQNESNVDLNRNWRRDHVSPIPNDAYDLIHPLACPDTPGLPGIDELFAAAGALVAERGLVWVRDGITTGQYRHADGLHYGGDRSEASTIVLEGLVGERLLGAQAVLTVDLHTGHGPRGEITLLSDASPGTRQEQFLRAGFPGLRVEATADNPDATTGVKSGQIANGWPSAPRRHLLRDVRRVRDTGTTSSRRSTRSSGSTVTASAAIPPT